MIIKKVEIVSGGQCVRKCCITNTKQFHGLKIEYHPWQMLNLVGVCFKEDGLLILHENQNRINSGFDKHESVGNANTYQSYDDKEIGSHVKMPNTDSDIMTIERIEQFPDGGVYFYCWWYDARQIIRRAWFHEDDIKKK